MATLSKNPSDYIFSLVKIEGCRNWCAAITPKDFFVKNRYMNDRHLPLKIPGWACVQEGIYEGNKRLSPEELCRDLVSKGFTYSPLFTTFLQRHDAEDVFFFERPLEIPLSVMDAEEGEG